MQVSPSNAIATPAPIFQCGRRRFVLSRPILMGVVNVTPDSFSDGGDCLDPQAAIEHGTWMFAAGAAILDIGGESSRPGAQPVSAAEELERILPVLAGLRALDVALSVDTSKPEVMRTAIAAGADMVNDINGFRAPGALEAVAPTDAGICIMHMQGEPRTMQDAPRYGDVVEEVGAFLAQRARLAQAAGIAAARIAIDPGFGFGKTQEHNLALLRQLGDIARLGWPLLVGLSRKSMLGRITGQPVEQRVHASVGAALLAAVNGARILRVHDVEATRDALAVLDAIRG